MPISSDIIKHNTFANGVLALAKSSAEETAIMIFPRHLPDHGQAGSMCFHYGGLLNSNCCGLSALLWINEANITLVTEGAWNVFNHYVASGPHILGTTCDASLLPAIALAGASMFFARCRSPSSSLAFFYKRLSRFLAGFKRVQNHAFVTFVAQLFFPSRKDNVLPPRFDSKASGNFRHMPKKSVEHIHLGTIGGGSLRM